MANAELIRRTVYYSGRVQGVGFRYTACHIARRFDVTGFVKNLADGRVQAVIEGPAIEVDRFDNAVRSEMASNIRGVITEQGISKGEYRDFGVRY